VTPLDDESIRDNTLGCIRCRYGLVVYHPLHRNMLIVPLLSRFASYSTSKLAVFRLWDSVGFANPDMSIFHLQPGVVDTDMNKEAGGVKAMGFRTTV
jgi:NAD(P)-dependent dehydrogenase (short-subunit alcohol dehydrogenase family)